MFPLITKIGFKNSHLASLQNCLGAYVWRDHGVEMVCVMVRWWSCILCPQMMVMMVSLYCMVMMVTCYGYDSHVVHTHCPWSWWVFCMVMMVTYFMPMVDGFFCMVVIVTYFMLMVDGFFLYGCDGNILYGHDGHIFFAHCWCLVIHFVSS